MKKLRVTVAEVNRSDDAIELVLRGRDWESEPFRLSPEMARVIEGDLQ